MVPRFDQHTQKEVHVESFKGIWSRWAIAASLHNTKSFRRTTDTAGTGSLSSQI